MKKYIKFKFRLVLYLDNMNPFYPTVFYDKIGRNWKNMRPIGHIANLINSSGTINKQIFAKLAMIIQNR